MKLKLSNSDAQRMLGALRSIDMNDSVKLAGMTRLDVARNINILMKQVAVFERESGALRRGILPGEANIAANNAIVEKLEKMSSEEQSYSLHQMDHATLRLDDNPRITGDMIAALAPILKDFDTMKEDEQ